jgi:uncharacterized protein (DUF1697 family)
MIALIRGINVGRAKRIAMADLRSTIEEIGFSDVRTLLNSGNVVFTAPGSAIDAAARIEGALVAEHSISARVICLTAAELETIVAGNPLRDHAADPSRFLVAVLSRPADRRKLAPLADHDWTPEGLAIGKRAVYLWCPGGVLASRVAQEVNRLLGDAVTARNWATITRLLALASIRDRAE